MRRAAVALIALWSLATTLPDIALPWHPLASYGLFQRAGVVSKVVPGGPAAREGIAPGDRIELAAMDANDRRHLYGAVYANSAQAGDPLHLVIDRGNVRRGVVLRSRLLARSLADNATDVVLILSQCASVLIASWLVLQRPGLMTWSFFLYNIAGTGLSTLLNASVSLPFFALQFGTASFFFGARSAAFAVFILRFPHDRSEPRSRTAEIVFGVAGLALGALAAYAATAPTFYGHVTGGVNAFIAIAGFVVYALAAAAFVLNYTRASRAEQQRLKWLLFGLVTGLGGSTAFDLMRWFVPGVVSIPAYNTMYALNVLLPVTLAYAILRHRVIDVGFVVSRTIVYAAIAAFVVGLFSVSDWLFS